MSYITTSLLFVRAFLFRVLRFVRAVHLRLHNAHLLGERRAPPGVVPHAERRRRRARERRRLGAERAATAALRAGNNAWGGAAFAEKMRVMEAEVYGADEAKNAKKKKDNK